MCQDTFTVFRQKIGQNERKRNREREREKKKKEAEDENQPLLFSLQDVDRLQQFFWMTSIILNKKPIHTNIQYKFSVYLNIF